MDAGDLLPAKLSTIFARLRKQAYRMPPQQLDEVLKGEWGVGWRRRFAQFEASPFAAVSIGQVHRATLLDGAYRPRAAAGRGQAQLADEANYLREGAQMRGYRERLASDQQYVVPELHADLTTARGLPMEFVKGRPIETLTDADDATRDAAMTALISLVLRELFASGVMQTDPNFANYRWQPETGRLVVLDFGATRAVPGETAAAFRRLIVAGLARDLDRVRAIAVETSFLGAEARRRTGPPSTGWSGRSMRR